MHVVVLFTAVVANSSYLNKNINSKFNEWSKSNSNVFEKPVKIDLDDLLCDEDPPSLAACAYPVTENDVDKAILDLASEPKNNANFRAAKTNGPYSFPNESEQFYLERTADQDGIIRIKKVVKKRANNVNLKDTRTSGIQNLMKPINYDEEVYKTQMQKRNVGNRMVESKIGEENDLVTIIKDIKFKRSSENNGDIKKSREVRNKNYIQGLTKKDKNQTNTNKKGDKNGSDNRIVGGVSALQFVPVVHKFRSKLPEN